MRFAVIEDGETIRRKGLNESGGLTVDGLGKNSIESMRPSSSLTEGSAVVTHVLYRRPGPKLITYHGGPIGSDHGLTDTRFEGSQSATLG